MSEIELPRFLPYFLCEHIEETQEQRFETRALRFDTVALFADISGFTALTERLAQEGSEGVEQLTRALNGRFTQLTECVFDHGGDVVKFAGDAMLVIWRIDEEQTPRRAAQRAVACALDLVSLVDAEPDVCGEVLRLRFTVGVGSMLAKLLGGLLERWELLVSGPVIDDLGTITGKVEAGQVVASQAAAGLLTEVVTTSARPDGVLVEASKGAPTQRKLAPRAWSDETHARLMLCVPGAARSSLREGRGDAPGELRTVTTLFLALPQLHGDLPLARGQAGFLHLQRLVYRYEGSINKLSVDEKGVVLLMVMGLPPVVHEDDAARGVELALALEAELVSLGWRTSIGVATGRAYCGVVGGPRRCEFTVMGDVVNLSARLMQAAENEVLVDAETLQRAGRQGPNKLLFGEPRDLRLKGKSEPVVAHGVARRSTFSTGPVARPVFGRTRELATLGAWATSAWQSAREGHAGACHGLIGPAGSGKSALIARLGADLEFPGGLWFLGAADKIDRWTPFLAWRPVVLAALGCEPGGESAQLTAAAEASLARTDGRVEHVPLLGLVFARDWPDNSVTRGLSGAARFECLLDVLCRIFEDAGRGCGLIIVLEDAHWLDSSSLALTRAVATRAPGVVLILSARPDESVEVPELRSLRQMRSWSETFVGPLDRQGVSAMVGERLGVRGVPDELVDVVMERTSGQAFFVEELVRALLRSRVIEVVEGVARLPGGREVLEEMGLPDDVAGILTRRVNQLSAAQLSTVKVASVFGRRFSVEDLRAVHTDGPSLDVLQAQLRGLASDGILAFVTSQSGEEVVFTHAMAQVAIYELMLFQQRRAFHAAIGARLSERADAHELVAIRAHHVQAGIDPRDPDPARVREAVELLELAGERARLNCANREVLALYGRIFVLSELLPEGLAVARVMRWRCRLGEACFGLGDFAGVASEFQEVLTLIGEPPRASFFAKLRQIGREALVQGSRLWLRAASVSDEVDDERRAQRLDVVRAHSFLCSRAVLECAGYDALRHALRGLNLAETLSPSPELMLSIAFIGNTAAALGNRGLAERYFARARALAERFEGTSDATHMRMLEVLYLLGRARWELFDPKLDHCEQRAREQGYREIWEPCLAMRGLAAGLRGRSDESRAAYERVLRAGESSGDARSEAWGLCGLLELALRRAEDLRLEPYDGYLRRAAGLLGGRLHRVDRIRVIGDLARAYAARGEIDKALEYAWTGARNLDGAKPTTSYAFEGWCGVAEILIVHNPEPAESATSKLRGLLREMAGSFKLTVPRTLYVDGLWRKRRGEITAAARSFVRCEEVARSIGLVWDEARAAMLRLDQEMVAAEDRPELAARVEGLLRAMGSRKLEVFLRSEPERGAASGSGSRRSRGSDEED